MSLSNEKLKLLQIQYSKDLPQKKLYLQQSWLKLKQNWSVDEAKKLHKLIHDLNGSAGTYGYPKLSQQAQKIEFLLSQSIKEDDLQAYLEPLNAEFNNLNQNEKQNSHFNPVTKVKNFLKKLKIHFCQDEEFSLLSEIFNSTYDAIVIVDLHGKILRWNPAAHKLYGYSESEAIGKSIEIIFPDHEKNVFLQPELLLSQEYHSFNAVRKHKNGKKLDVFVAVSPIYNVHGEKIGYSKISHDISDKILEEKRFADILEATPDAIIIINNQGEIVFCNRQTEVLFGYTKKELVGQPVEILMPASFSKKHQLHRQKYFESPRVRHMGTGQPLFGMRKNREHFPVEISLSPLQQKEGMLALAAIRDITDRKKAEKMKSEFISMVSHELRTPLTSLQGSLYLVSAGIVGELPEKAQQLLKIAEKNCDRLINLINDILDLEKIEHNKMQFDLKNIDIETLIEEAIVINQSYAKKYNVNLAFKNFHQNIEVLTDKERLMQVLTNLISNAVKFSPEASTVTINIEKINGNVRVNVIDQGEGIPKEFQNKIFDKFTQVDSSSTRKKGGTGLGLNISKVIIQKLHGSLSYVSEVSKGSTFYFELPIRNKSKQAKKSLTELADHFKASVLVCDIDKNITQKIKKILEKNGLEVTIAYNAEEAKALVKETHFNALMLDLNLPGRDVIAFIEEVRSDTNMQNSPFILMSIQDHNNELSGNAFSVLDWISETASESRLKMAIQNIKNSILDSLPKILHVEDDLEIFELASSLLQGEALLINAKTISEAQNLLETENFNLVILDLLLPDGSSTELLPILSKQQIPVIVFSAYALPKNYLDTVRTVLLKSETSHAELLKVILAAIHPIPVNKEIK